MYYGLIRASMLAMAMLLFTVFSMAQTDCAVYNIVTGPFNYGSLDLQEHQTGSHQFANVTGGNCTYDGTAIVNVPVNCNVISRATSSSGSGDSGSLTFLTYHTAAYGDAQGSATSNGGAATSDSEGVAAVRSCKVLPCDMSLTISGSGTGGGFTIGYSSTPLWSDKYHNATNCTAKSLPPMLCPPQYPKPPNPDPETCLGGYSWNYTTCRWELHCKNSSPLIVDTSGKKIQLTDPQTDCVTFDLAGTGKYECWSWPKHGSGNAWLVYDRDGNGIIDSGQELFGNFTPHSDGGVKNHPDPNGFLALAWFDQAAQGGNMDAILDERDAVWSKLRLWIDEHCYLHPEQPCKSLPQELYRLEDKGIKALSLVFTGDANWDTYGNQFRFWGVVNPDKHYRDRDENGHGCCDLQRRSSDQRRMYDVYLVPRQ